jgi:hypothetical protein
MMSDKSVCLWQYPLPNDQLDFLLLVPKGAEFVKLVEQETLFGKGFTLLMRVDPSQDTGEAVSFHLVSPGQPYDPRMVFLGGPMQMGLYLIMDPHRTPHDKQG